MEDEKNCFEMRIHQIFTFYSLFKKINCAKKMSVKFANIFGIFIIFTGGLGKWGGVSG